MTTLPSVESTLQQKSSQKISKPKITYKHGGHAFGACHGGSYWSYHQPRNQKQTIKIGELQLEESTFFDLIKYYKSIYCVLYHDGIINYYRNQNDYYMNEKFSIQGFIDLSQGFTINDVTPSSDDNNDSESIFEIKVNKPKHKQWRLKCKDQKARDEWIDAINSLNAK